MFYYGETKRLTKGKIYVVLTRHPFELQLFKVEKKKTVKATSVCTTII